MVSKISRVLHICCCFSVRSPRNLCELLANQSVLCDFLACLFCPCDLWCKPAENENLLSICFHNLHRFIGVRVVIVPEGILSVCCALNKTIFDTLHVLSRLCVLRSVSSCPRGGSSLFLFNIGIQGFS